MPYVTEMNPQDTISLNGRNYVTFRKKLPDGSVQMDVRVPPGTTLSVEAGGHIVNVEVGNKNGSRGQLKVEAHRDVRIRRVPAVSSS